MLSWSAMFVMWLAAWPLITIAILHSAPGDPGALHRGMVWVAGSYALYAALGAALNLAVPWLTRRVPPRVLYAMMVLAGALGLAALGLAGTPAALLPAFALIGVAWCAIANLAYDLAGAAMDEEEMPRGFRLFAFSAVLPQLAVFAALALAIPAVDPAAARHLLFAAAGAMALGGLVALLPPRAPQEVAA